MLTGVLVVLCFLAASGAPANPASTIESSSSTNVPQDSPKIERIFYLNPDSRTDRRDWMQSHLTSASNGVPFERRSAVKVTSFEDASNTAEFKPYLASRTLAPEISSSQQNAASALSTYLSHMMLYDSIIKDHVRPDHEALFLVLEDDVELAPNWEVEIRKAALRLPSDWQVLRVGRTGKERQEDFVTEGIYAAHPPFTSTTDNSVFYGGSHAIVLRSSTLPQLSQGLLKLPVADMANMLTSCCSIKSFVSKDVIVEQLSATTTENPNRKWTPAKSSFLTSPTSPNTPAADNSANGTPVSTLAAKGPETVASTETKKFTEEDMNGNEPRPMKPSRHVEQIYFINMDKRTDRRSWIQSHLAVSAPGIPVSRHSAVKVTSFQSAISSAKYKAHLQGRPVAKDIERNSRKNAMFALSVFLSHMTLYDSILKTHVQENHEAYFLVIEDDVELEPGWQERIREATDRLPSDWQILRVGIWGKDRSADEVIPGIFAARAPYWIPETKTIFYGGTHGILLRSSTLGDFMKGLRQIPVTDIDAMLTMCCDHIKSYVLKRPIAKLIPSASDNPKFNLLSVSATSQSLQAEASSKAESYSQSIYEGRVKDMIESGSK